MIPGIDTAPLTLSHLVMFGGSFAAVFGLLGLLLSRATPPLRPHLERPQVYYAGVVVLAVISVLGYVVLESGALKTGLLAATFLTLVVGVIDEQLRLSASRQLLWQVVIAVVAVSWGWTIPYVSHPSGAGILSLDWYAVGGIVLPGSLLAVVWLVFLMNAINWLDGVDGLASGVGVVALATLALVSLLPSVQDSQTLKLALLGAGALLGFLLWNFPPARVYLGTTGSWLVGLYIGMVAIVGGGKVVTTLLVLALPVIDLLAVAAQRIVAGQAPWQGDRQRHLHFRLQAAGLSARTITLGAMAITAVLGVAALVLQTYQKMIALGAAGVLVSLLILALVYRQSLLSRRASVYSEGETHS